MHLKITTIATGAFVITDEAVQVTVTAGKITAVSYGSTPTVVTGITTDGVTRYEYGELNNKGDIDAIWTN